jgi:hypothetical protein
VLVLGDGVDAGHWRLQHLTAGGRFAFGGRVFETDTVGEALAVRATGDVLGRVVDTFVRTAPEVIDAEIAYEDGATDVLTGTPNHPFWVDAIGDYVPLGELEVGTVLHVQGGGEAILVSKTWRQGDFEVFDFEVDGLHNFYVRGSGSDAAGVLVHNSTGPVKTLHRAVGPDELADIKATGELRPGPGMEGKWFADNADDAKTWGDKMDFGGKPTTIEADFPAATADDMFQMERLDGIGPARYADEAQLGDCCAIRIPDE